MTRRWVGACGRPSVPEERYRLMAQGGPIRLLDTSVQGAAGKEAVLDLAANATSVSPPRLPLGRPNARRRLKAPGPTEGGSARRPTPNLV